MATTPMETWQNVDGTTIGAIYPFVGTEIWWCVALLVIWVVWHICQTRQETKEIENDVEVLRKNGNLERVVKGDNLLF
jgi:hypothetical protein